jgi:hypothetical protein
VTDEKPLLLRTGVVDNNDLNSSIIVEVSISKEAAGASYFQNRKGSIWLITIVLKGNYLFTRVFACFSCRWTKCIALFGSHLKDTVFVLTSQSK